MPALKSEESGCHPPGSTPLPYMVCGDQDILYLNVNSKVVSSGQLFRALSRLTQGNGFQPHFVAFYDQQGILGAYSC